MKQKIPIIWAGVILLAVLLGVAAWNHWFSATRIAFVNYQATTLGQIARANDHARIRLASSNRRSSTVWGITTWC